MNSVTAELRSSKAKARSLRRAGLIPCCIYGPQLSESISIQISQNDAEMLFRKDGEGNKVKINLNDEKMVVLIKDISRNSIKQEIEHIGFHALVPDKKVNSTAKVVLLNKDKVAGFISQVLFEIPYTALPADIVDAVTIDLKDLKVGSRLTISDLEISKNDKIELLIDTDSVILSIADSRRLPLENAE